nr:DUF2332 family protein [Shimia biformata]
MRDAFREQAGHCAALDSPFMARLLTLLAGDWPEDTKLSRKLTGFPGDIGPMGASLPLRVAGGLHALHLQGIDPDLSAVYPPANPPEDLFRSAIIYALYAHDTFLTDWVTHAPQTNELRRAAALIAGTRLLTTAFDLPIRVSELGASAGLNLMFDQFALETSQERLGPDTSTLTLSPDWTGPLPEGPASRIIERRGVDLNPLNPRSEDGRLRLMAYLWPDQVDRLARTRAAIAAHDAEVDKGDAIDWLAGRLEHEPGRMHLIYHTIAWQYFPAEAQKHGTSLIEAAGKRATDDAPLAWLRMEGDDAIPGAALDLRLWPGDRHIQLGRIDFHGRWINWTGPFTLT